MCICWKKFGPWQLPWTSIARGCQKLVRMSHVLAWERAPWSHQKNPKNIQKLFFSTGWSPVGTGTCRLGKHNLSTTQCSCHNKGFRCEDLPLQGGVECLWCTSGIGLLGRSLDFSVEPGVEKPRCHFWRFRYIQNRMIKIDIKLKHAVSQYK